MNETSDSLPYYIGVLVGDEGVWDRLQSDLDEIRPPEVKVHRCCGEAEAESLIRRAADGEIHLPVFIIEDCGEFDAIAFIRGVESQKGNDRLGFIRLAPAGEIGGRDRLIETDSPSRTLTLPWLREVLVDALRDLMFHYLLNYERGGLDRFRDLVGLVESQSSFPVSPKEEGLSFLSERELTDQQAFEAMVREIDEVLKTPPRRTLPPGTVLFSEGEAVEEVYILESGRVRLTRQAGEREVLFHSHSARRILGLLALAQYRRAFFTCRSVTEVCVIPIEFTRLNEALIDHPRLASRFATVLVRSLAARNRRVAELQLEIENLNSQLIHERDQLSQTLQLLAAAQGRIIESDRMATLGKLAAGVAHELNNPAAAINRTASHLVEDLISVLAAESGDDGRLEFLKRGLETLPLSTREERALRSDFAERVGDESLARRILSMGIHNLPELERFLKSSGNVREAAAVGERFFRIGRALRNLSHCSQRVTDLVISLKSFARWDKGEVVEGDIHQGIEDALAIFSHELRRIRITRNYSGLPRIQCQMGRLNQVWTNLLSNAIQAMGGEGELLIETSMVGENRVRISLSDSGPGIPEDRLDKLLVESFTTRSSESDFGLGLGLTICREILEAQGGDIRFESRPGRTTAIVTLPIRARAVQSEGGTGFPSRI